jgi:hypothetical protein
MHEAWHGHPEMWPNDHVIILVEDIWWQKHFYVSHMDVYGRGTSKGREGRRIKTVVAMTA